MALFAIVAAGGGWQLLDAATTRWPGRFNLFDPHWQGFLGRQFSGSLFLGEIASRLPVDGAWFAGLSIILAWFLAAYLLRQRDPEIATVLLGGLLCLAAGAWAYRYVPFVIDHVGIRYYFIPFVCVAWSLLLIAERSRSLKVRVQAILGVGLILLAASTHFVFEPLRDLHWAEASRQIGSGHPCEIPINPVPWTIHIRG